MSCFVSLVFCIVIGGAREPSLGVFWGMFPLRTLTMQRGGGTQAKGGKAQHKGFQTMDTLPLQEPDSAMMNRLDHPQEGGQ